MKKFILLTIVGLCSAPWLSSASAQTIKKTPILGAIQENVMISGELIGGKSNHIIVSKAHEHPYSHQIVVPVIDGKFQLALPAGDSEAYMLIPEENFDAGFLRPFVVFVDENVYVTLHPSERYLENTTLGSPLTDEYHRAKADIEQRLSKRSFEVDSLWKLVEAGKVMEEEAAKKDSALGADYLTLQEAYIREHPTLVSYQLIKELLITNEDEHANQIAKQHYPAFAALFPNHPYTATIGNHLNGKFQLEQGKQYISFLAEDLDGNPVLADTLLAPKATLLNFWASWCGPCIHKARTMVPVYEAFKDKGFDIINVAREIRGTESLKALLEREQLPWSTNLVDPNSKYGVWTKYGITNLGGAMVLVDGTGNILAVNPTADEVKELFCGIGNRFN